MEELCAWEELLGLEELAWEELLGLEELAWEELLGLEELAEEELLGLEELAEEELLSLLLELLSSGSIMVIPSLLQVAVKVTSRWEAILWPSS